MILYLCGIMKVTTSSMTLCHILTIFNIALECCPDLTESIESVGGLEFIEGLRYHDNTEINELAQDIIIAHFEEVSF